MTPPMSLPPEFRATPAPPVFGSRWLNSRDGGYMPEWLPQRVVTAVHHQYRCRAYSRPSQERRPRCSLNRSTRRTVAAPRVQRLVRLISVSLKTLAPVSAAPVRKPAAQAVAREGRCLQADPAGVALHDPRGAVVRQPHRRRLPPSLHLRRPATASASPIWRGELMHRIDNHHAEW